MIYTVSNLYQNPSESVTIFSKSNIKLPGHNFYSKLTDNSKAKIDKILEYGTQHCNTFYSCR